MKTTKNTIALLLGLFAPVALNAAIIDVFTDGSLTSNSTAGLLGTNIRIITANQTWTSGNTYFITDRIYIPAGVTLTIEPGTKIYSSTNDNGTPANKADDKVGALVATRNGKLVAEGTAANPIVFSSVREWEGINGVDSPYDADAAVGPAPTSADAGQWGGIVLCGRAPIGTLDAGGLPVQTLQVEGFAPSGSASNDGDLISDASQYGGSTGFPQEASDSSGVLRYISIRHGGYEYDTAKEINGLTLAGVGSGTVIDHIEVYANSDDGIEFFGGTVNTSYMVMAFNQDDSFDIDEGYKGTNQFWFCIQNPGISDAGGEWDGVSGTITGSPGATNAANSTIQSKPIIYNATFVGPGRDRTLTRLPNTSGQVNWEKGNFALHIEDYFNGEIYNSVFDDFADKFIKYNDNALSAGTTAKFSHNTVGRFGSAPRTQIETSTITGTASGTGNISVVVAGTGVTGSPFSVAITSGDSRETVTTKVAAVLAAVPSITANFFVEVSPITPHTIVFTNKVAGNNDAALQVSIATALGITSANSANTVVGSATGPVTVPVVQADNLTYVQGTAPTGFVVYNALGAPVNNNSSPNTDPMFTAYTRDGSSFLTTINPIPQAGSPLLTSPVAPGAPVVANYRGAFGPSGNWAAGWTKFSTSGVLAGAAPVVIVDADGDGIDDTLEATSALTSLGFSAGVNNVTPTNLFSSLYTSTSIQDLRGNGLMIGPVTGANATVTLPLFKSTGLNTWTAAGNVTGTVDTTPGKSFFRVETAAPNQ